MTYKIIDGKLYLFFNGDFNGKQFNTLTNGTRTRSSCSAELPAKWSKLNDKGLMLCRDGDSKHPIMILAGPGPAFLFMDYNQG